MVVFSQEEPAPAKAGVWQGHSEEQGSVVKSQEDVPLFHDQRHSPVQPPGGVVVVVVVEEVLVVEVQLPQGNGVVVVEVVGD